MFQSTTSVIDLGHEQSRHTGDIVQLWEADELYKNWELNLKKNRKHKIKHKF
jgi:hypothetical protein